VTAPELSWEGGGLPLLTTERLVARLAREGEARKVADYFDRNRFHHRRAGGTRSEEYYTEVYWADTIPLERADARLGACFRFRVFLRDDETRILGAVSLRRVEHGVNHSCALGYSLDKDHTGRGYMREAVRAAIRFAFEELNLMRIEATYVPDNERSAKVLAALGFEVEGTLRKMMMVEDEFADHVVCSLLNPNWRKD
jgi:ribosomal-protein-alanine N-acetyltransferase